MWVMLLLWAVFGFGVHLLVQPLNGIRIGGFPLGFYMAAQGSLIAFVIMLFVFARRQDAIDEQEGFAEPADGDGA
jgi:putative solute:sodium symporter small subunit